MSGEGRLSSRFADTESGANTLNAGWADAGMPRGPESLHVRVIGTVASIPSVKRAGARRRVHPPMDRARPRASRRADRRLDRTGLRVRQRLRRRLRAGHASAAHGRGRDRSGRVERRRRPVSRPRSWRPMSCKSLSSRSGTASALKSGPERRASSGRGEADGLAADQRRRLHADLVACTEALARAPAASDTHLAWRWVPTG